MLNAQPLGFYAPAQLVRDAREHGVEVREVDVNLSDWDCTLESLAPAAGEDEPSSGASRHPLPEGEGIHPRHADMAQHIRTTHAVRLGFRQIAGLKKKDMLELTDAARSWLRFGARLMAAQRVEFDSAGAACRRRRLPLARARSAPSLMGGARPRSSGRPGRSAALRKPAGARDGAGHAIAADAARRACGRGLSALVLVAQGSSGLVHARAPFFARNPAL